MSPYSLSMRFLVLSSVFMRALAVASETQGPPVTVDKPDQPIFYYDENHSSRVPFDSVDDNLSAEQASEQRYGEDRWLPLFRKRAIEKGIFLPWPYGLSVVATRFSEQLELDSLSIKLANGTVIDGGTFSSLVEPRDLDVNNYSLRFDAWVFPFLNLYGIAGKTAVDLNLDLLNQPTTTFPDRRNSFGGGAILAGGIGVFFGMIDLRYSQTDVSLSTDGAKTYTTLIRAGWNGKLGRANGAIWGGVMKQRIDLQLDVKASDFAQAPPLLAGAEIEITMQSSRGYSPMIGTRWDITTHWDVSVEYSFDQRNYLVGNLGYRF